MPHFLFDFSLGIEIAPKVAFHFVELLIAC